MEHSIEVINKNLSKLQKLKYNQFFWWRRWGTKNKPLHKNSLLLDKINNGDYDFSPYFWQLKYCEWEIKQKELKYKADIRRFCEEAFLDLQRRKRLREDHEKYERENLEQLKKDFIITFRMAPKDYDEDIVKFDGDVKDFYIYCEHKYKKYNIITTKPRRGRPPKNKS
jgi:hypothetical protein